MAIRLDEWLRLMEREYFTSFIPAGGAAVRVAVAEEAALSGVLARLSPQLNVFFVVLPAQIILGMAIFMIALPTVILIFVHFFDNSMHGVLKRLAWKDAGKSVWVVSAGAALWLLVSVGFSGIFSGILPDFKGTPTDVAKLTIFHGLSTFIGYYLRFYAVPRLSTVTYSVLSYSGIFASYLFGLWFLGEKPSVISLLGALLILVSGIFLMPI